MKKFTVLVAHDVPHYGTFEIEAANPDQALAKIREMDLRDLLDGARNDPAFDASTCARIVHMQDQAGYTAHEDTPLDHTYVEWASIDDLASVLGAAENYLSGDTHVTRAMLLRRIRTALGKAAED